MTSEPPKTDFALISGTAGWGIRFPDDLKEPGVRVVERGLSFETPWGPTENWQVLEFDGSITVDGKSRTALNVFAHGWRSDQIDHTSQRRVFWILKEAGVRKVLADSTCGSLNRAIQPRDLVIANDMLYLAQTEFSILPGRMQYLCRGKQMFCPSMSAVLETEAREAWPSNYRVFGQANALVVAHTWGPRFETPAEAQALRLMGADYVSQSMCPEATYARESGACFASNSYVVNFVDGIIPEEWGALDGIHTEMAALAPRISLRALARTPLTDDCGCASYRAVRPRKYAAAGPAQAKGPVQD